MVFEDKKIDNKQLLNFVACNSRDVIWLTDDDDNIIYISSVVEQYTSESTSYFINKKVDVLLASLNCQEITIQKEHKTAQLFDNLKIELHDKRCFNAECVIENNYNDNKYAGHKAILKITNELSSLDSEIHAVDLLKAIAENSLYAFVIVDLNCRVETYNKAAIDLFRLYNNCELKPNFDFCHYFTNEIWAAHQQAKKGERISTELQSRNLNSVNWFEFHFTPLYDDKNNISGVFVSGKDITKSKKIEYNLRKSKANLRAIFESSPSSYFLIDGDNKLLTFNKKGKKIVNQLLGKNITKRMDFLNVVPLEYQKEFFEFSAKALNNKETNIEKKFVTDEGDEKWFEIHFLPAVDGNDAVFAIAVTVNDITERILLNQKIERQKDNILRHKNILEEYNVELQAINSDANEKNEELKLLNDEIQNKQSQLAAIIENAPIALCAINTNNDIVNFNQKFKQFIKSVYNIDILPYNTLSKVFDKIADVKIIHNNAKANKGENISYEHHFKNGYRTIYALVHHAPVINKDEVVATLIIVTDITKRRKIEQTLEYEKNILHTFLANSVDKIFFKDVNHRFIRVNESWVKLFKDIDIEDVMGKDDFDFFDERFAEQTHKDENRIIQTGKPIINKEELFYNELGIPVWLESTKIAWYDDDKQIIGTFGIARDITKRKMAEEKLKEQTQQLVELNATKDKFFSIIAHDLKNPFSTVIQLSDLLISTFHKKDKEKILYFIKLINETSNAAFALLENLLNWSRSQTGRLKVLPTKFDIYQLIKEVYALNSISAKNKNITIDTSACQSFNILADPQIATTVLRNLMSNAIKFTNNDGTITIRTFKKDEKNLLVEIADNGIGIEDKDLNAIFKLGTHRTTAGTNNESGTGLGLILCKEFVEINGGEIFVKSKKNEGSTFSFTLPLFS